MQTLHRQIAWIYVRQGECKLRAVANVGECAVGQAGEKRRGIMLIWYIGVSDACQTQRLAKIWIQVVLNVLDLP